MDAWFEHKRVVESRVLGGADWTELEYHDLFADMGIGRGIQEYERGLKLLEEYTGESPLGVGCCEYVEALKKWCEV